MDLNARQRAYLLATHWLVVDRAENRAYVAPVSIARAIVRAQDLEARP